MYNIYYYFKSNEENINLTKFDRLVLRKFEKENERKGKLEIIWKTIEKVKISYLNIKNIM